MFLRGSFGVTHANSISFVRGSFGVPSVFLRCSFSASEFRRCSFGVPSVFLLSSKRNLSCISDYLPYESPISCLPIGISTDSYLLRKPSSLL